MTIIMRGGSLKDAFYLLSRGERNPVKFFLALNLETQITVIVTIANVLSVFSKKARDFISGSKTISRFRNIPHVFKEGTTAEKVGVVFGAISAGLFAAKWAPKGIQFIRQYRHLVLT